MGTDEVAKLQTEIRSLKKQVERLEYLPSNIC